MTLRQRQSIFIHNIGKLILFAYENGYEFTGGELLRTDYQQKEYVRTGYSKTTDSRHLQKLAIDFNIFINGRYLFADKNNHQQYVDDLFAVKILGDYWESLNPDNVWGGDWNRDNILNETFKDPYHFEMKP